MKGFHLIGDPKRLYFTNPTNLNDKEEYSEVMSRLKAVGCEITKTEKMPYCDIIKCKIGGDKFDVVSYIDGDGTFIYCEDTNTMSKLEKTFEYNKFLIDKLNKTKHLDKTEWITFFDTWDEDERIYAAGIAKNIAQSIYGNKIYIRGIVEFSNICRNDCYYCGIRKSNQNVSRYCLTEEEILDCCKEGHELGFRTFVLQSGEHVFKPQQVAEAVKKIKAAYPECAVTLSLGEEEYETYKLWREAGADRYLLRHETANEEHYKKLHPENMSWSHRMDCLKNLKKLGYQTGAGIMVGSPYQTSECLADDMLFFESFKPEMIGIGPFLPHKDTPFKDEPKGSYELTLFLLSLCRIMLPSVLLPATTALGTINPRGREEGVLAGANVIMPNLSPTAVRKKYMLYDNKICTGDESAQCRGCLERRMESIGYEIEISRGDYKGD